MAKSKLTLDQEQALHYLTSEKQNLFITGGAGTGKSFLIQEYLRHRDGKTPILASTGAAAILVGGRTFHSFFGLGIMQGGPEATLQRALENKRLRKRIRDASEIIIDEISMLSSDTVDCAEKIARTIRNREDEAWGGIRVVAVGDFAQLPPVTKGLSSFAQKWWAFLGEAWQRSKFKILHLKEVVRTEDAPFLRVLEDLRYGRVSSEVRWFLNQRVRGEAGREVMHLFPRRDQTERFNLAKLAELPGEAKRYDTYYVGEGHYLDQIKRDAPIPAVLELKKGALVMIRINDPRQRYANGTIGRVVGLHEELVELDLGGRRVEIETYAFSLQDADGKEIAFAKNFPLNLAYASTIHKIQGATLDRVHIDLSRLWEPGQAYVALSRTRSGSDVTVSAWSESSIRADPHVLDFYDGKEPRRETFEDLY